MKKLSTERVVLSILVLLIALILVFLIALLDGEIGISVRQSGNGGDQSYSFITMNSGPGVMSEFEPIFQKTSGEAVLNTAILKRQCRRLV